MSILYDPRDISVLDIEDVTLKVLTNAGITTVGDLQKRLISGEKIYLVGPRRHDYLVSKLKKLGLTAERPWTDRLHQLAFGRDDEIATVTTKGESELASRLIKWFYTEHNIPYGNARANPLFVFCGRIGCGKIERTLPSHFDEYEDYKLVAWENGRFNYRVLTSGQISRVTGASIEEVNRIYQRCLAFIRKKDIVLELSILFRTYAEDRR